MNTWRKVLRLLAFSYFALGPVAVLATPITYNFTVTATNGPLAGTSASGTFTYDTSTIPAVLPGVVAQTGLLTDLAFVWDGISYDETTANTGELDFDAGGSLTTAFFGTKCAAGTCQVPTGTEAWSFSSLGFFFYTVPGENVLFSGTASMSGPVSVPEPATFALLGLGIFGLGFARRRRAAVEFSGILHVERLVATVSTLNLS